MLVCCLVALAARSACALQEPKTNSTPIGVVSSLAQLEPTASEQIPRWFESSDFTDRLRAVEIENANLRAELTELRNGKRSVNEVWKLSTLEDNSLDEGVIQAHDDQCGCTICCQETNNPQEAACVDCPRVTMLGNHFSAEVFGTLKLDMLFNTARPQPPGSPFYLRNRRPLENNDNVLSIHARASLLGLKLNGPPIGNFQSGGIATVFFFNDSVSEDKYGILPLNVWGELRNDDWRFSAGLQLGVFNSRNPTMLVWGALGSSGNSGNVYKGQVRIERYINPSEDSQWTYKLALTEPVTTLINDELSINEDNGWPNIESRLSYGVGPAEGGLIKQRPFEIGVSGLIGQVRTEPVGSAEVVANTWGVGTDLHWETNDRTGINAEFFTGQGLGSYTAGIAQTTNTVTFNSIRTTGGFVELYHFLKPQLHTHFGFGIDDPIDRDLDPSQRTRNQTYFSNLIWDVTPLFRVGFEVTWRETNYIALIDNEGAGFHTQFQWKF